MTEQEKFNILRDIYNEVAPSVDPTKVSTFNLTLQTSSDTDTEIFIHQNFPFLNIHGIRVLDKGFYDRWTRLHMGSKQDVIDYIKNIVSYGN